VLIENAAIKQELATLRETIMAWGRQTGHEGDAAFQAQYATIEEVEGLERISVEDRNLLIKRLSSVGGSGPKDTLRNTPK